MCRRQRASHASIRPSRSSSGRLQLLGQGVAHAERRDEVVGLRTGVLPEQRVVHQLAELDPDLVRLKTMVVVLALVVVPTPVCTRRNDITAHVAGAARPLDADIPVAEAVNPLLDESTLDLPLPGPITAGDGASATAASTTDRRRRSEPCWPRCWHDETSSIHGRRRHAAAAAAITAHRARVAANGQRQPPQGRRAPSTAHGGALIRYSPAASSASPSAAAA